MYDIIFFTETWLHDDVPNSLLVAGAPYQLLRNDRLGRGGGVCVFINNSYSFSQVSIPAQYGSIEICAFDLLYNSQKCRFICVYRSPTYDTFDHVNLLCQCLHFLCDINYPFFW